MKKYTNQEAGLFAQQLAMMISSGLSAEEGLGIAAHDTPSGPAQDALLKIQNQIAMGQSFAESLAQSGLFDSTLIRMVEIGERTGYLDQVLQSLSDYYQRMEKIRISLKNALTYPLILLVMVIVVVGVILFKVLPVFDEVLSNLGISLSASAQLLMQAGSVLVIGSAVISIAVLIGVLAVLITRWRHPERSLTAVFAQIPGIRRVLEELSLAQVSFALALFTKSGYEIGESLSQIETLAEHPAVRRRLTTCRAKLTEKENFDQALLESGLFKESYARMIGIGLKTGQGDAMIAQVAARYEEDTETAVNQFLNTIEPLLIGLLSVIVGAILLSVMLPLMNIMSSIG